MTKVSLAYDILNYTPASASPVDANFDRLEQYANQELIERDGTVAMRAQLKLVGDPVAELDAAPKQYVDAVLPVGIIMMFGGSVAPPGGRWAICNGAEVETAVYPELYAVIGSAYTTGTVPAGRYNLPDLTNRFAHGGAPGTTGGNANAVVVDHTHSINHDHPYANTSQESNFHSHGGVDHLHPVNIWSGGVSAHHTHATGSGSHFVSYAAGGGFGAGGPGADFVLAGSTGWSQQDHAHAINGTTGGADRSLTTSGQNVLHVHGFDVPAFDGSSGGAAGATSPTNANLPPYIGVLHIIRVR